MFSLARYLLISLLLLLATPAWSATAQEIAESRAKALTWMVSHQESDGRWVGPRNLDVPATAEAVQAIQLSGIRSFPHSRGLGWLANADPTSVESIARKAHTLAVAGSDASASLNKLLLLRNRSLAWGAYNQFDSSFPDTALALAAFRSDNAQFASEQTSLTAALGCAVLATQRSGDPITAGSWTYSGNATQLINTGRESAVLPTAYNLLEIAAFLQRGISQASCPRTGATYSLSTALNLGVDWLLIRQRNTNGSFPSGQGNALQTALAYQAIASGRPGDASLASAHDYLIAQQLTDGSWQGDAFVTATVLKTFGSTTLVDTDGDGLPDSIETLLGTNPSVADSRQYADRNGQSGPGVTTPLVFNAVRNQAFTASLGVGSTPYTGGVLSGTLPTGLSINGGTGVVSGTPTSAGYYNFTFQYADANAVPRSVLAQIAVRASADTTAPVVTAPPAIVVEATSAQSRPFLGRAYAIDDVDGPIAPTPLPAGPYALGIHTITWRAVDAAGNIGTATQSVTIRDTTPPSITPPPDIQQLPTGQEPRSVSIGQATATDLFGPVQLSNDAPSLFPAGETIVTYTATDANNNTSTAQQRIQIVYPLPIAASLSPEFAAAGSDALTLTVNGAGFAPVSVVRWNGTNQTTTYVSSSQLQITVSAQQLAAAGEAAVTIFNPTPGGGLSNTVRFAITEGVVDFFDNFDRPDGAALGNGWIEKTPAAFALVTGEARKEAVSTFYADNLVYRPAIEDVLDGEASVELRFLSTGIGFPQVHARMQAETVAQVGGVDSYLVYVSDSASQAVLGRQRGGTLTTLANLTLSPTLSSGETYRLRLRAVGTNPVQLSGYVERFDSGAWTVIGQASVNDSASERIAAGGSMGFSGHSESGYAFDRFARQRLGDGTNPTPAITSLSPQFATVGDGNQTMTVRGSDFVPTSQVQWNGSPLTTTYLSPTRLTASVLAAHLASVGTANVTVFNPTPGGGSSSARTFTVYAVGQAPRPVPVLSSITPSYAIAGSSAFTLVATGSGFSSDSVIRWNGVVLPTTYLSATRLQASIGSSAIAAPASITVSVFTPTPGGGSSAGQILSVLESSALFSDSFDAPDAPDLANGWIEKNPDAFALVGAEARKLGVSTNYQDNLVYRPANEDVLNVDAGVELRLLGGGIGYPQLHVRVRGATVAQTGVLDSYMLYLPDDAARALLARQRGSGNLITLADITLSSALATGQIYRLRLRAVGTNPVQLAAYVERWIGSEQWEVLGQATATDATADRLSAAGSVGFSGSTEGSVYAYENFTRLDLGAQALPVPSISALNPTSATAGGSDFLLTVTGTNFATDTVVRWNGSARATTYVSATELQATITAADIADAGTATVTAFTDGAIESPGVSFTVAPPGPVVPTITSLQPGFARAGSGALTLTVNGTGFITGTVVRWNGVDRTTTLISSKQVTAAIPASDLVSEAEISITAVTSVGESSARLFSVVNAAVDQYDLFDRPDGGALGNGWIEKTAAAFTLASGEARKEAVSTFYADNLVYRPAIEDVLDGEGSVELRFLGSSLGYPQVHVRVQAETVTQAGGVDSYLLFVSDNATQAVLGRQRGSTLTTLGSLTLSPALTSGQTYRLRLRAVGTNPVQVSGYIEHFNSGAWTIIGQASANDSATDRIAVGGSMGFSGHSEAGYVFDRFVRQRLGDGSHPLPTITSLSPEFATVGDADLPLTVRGTNFVPASQLQWNGTSLTSTYLSPTRLTASVPAAQLATVGTANVTVFNPTPGGGSSAGRSFTVYAVGQAPRPVPLLTSITPSYAVAGSAGFALMASGSGFNPGSVIRWNGVALSTTYVSATRLQSSVSASAIAVPASITVSVFTPTPGGGSSAGQILSVLESSAAFSDSFDAPDAPDLANGWIEKNPDAFALVGAEARKQAVSTNYQDNLVYRPSSEDVLNVEAGVEMRLLAGGIGYPQLHVRVRAATVAQTGVLDSYMLYLPNDATRALLARQRGSSNLVTLADFTLSSALTTGQVYRLRLRAVGSSPVQLAAYVERWLGGEQWEVMGQATAGDATTDRLSAAGSVGFSGSVEGSLYAYENFTRLDLGAQALPVPTIGALDPTSVTAGGSDFLLAVTGTNFAPDTVVRWNGSARATTYVSGTEVQATIPATSIANPGNATVTVYTLNGGESGPATFTVRNPLAGSGPVRVILMAGQSNMNGWAPNASADPALLQSNTGTRIYFKPSVTPQNNGSWQVLQANTNNKLPLNTEHGPELRLAQQLVGTWGGEPPIFIIKFARDATGLDVNAPSASAGRGVWDPSVSGQLYDTFMDYYVRRGLQELIEAGLEPRIQAFVWMQGEEDAVLSTTAANYQTNLAAFIARIRTDLGTPNLPFIIGRIHDDMPAFDFPTVNVNTVRAAMQSVDTADANVQLIDTDALALRTDSLHFDAAGQSAFADAIHGVLSPMGLGAPYAPPARLLALTPDILTTGASSVVMTVQGVGFTTSSVVRLGGQARSTTFVSSTEIRATLLATDVDTAGSAAVTVTDATAGTTTNALTLRVMEAGGGFFDDFSRSDGAQIGNGWVEKNSDALSLSGGQVEKQLVSTSYHDNVVYRPSSEDELDTEASVEFRLLSGSPGYPQLFARLQSSTVASSGVLDGYMLHVNGNASEAVLGRQLGAGSVQTLATIAINPGLNTSATYRMRLRVVGTSPVALNAYIERLDGANWTVIGQATYDDAATSRIALPGSVGFGGYTENSYSYDNFLRLNLAP